MGRKRCVQNPTNPHKNEGWRALKMLAVEKDTTLNAFAVEAFNDLLKKHGKRQNVENHRLYFRTYNDKANLQPPADKSDWFKLESVSLGNGPLGAAGDSVGVVIQWQ